jgi:hypothetical protein
MVSFAFENDGDRFRSIVSQCYWVQKISIQFLFHINKSFCVCSVLNEVTEWLGLAPQSWIRLLEVSGCGGEKKKVSNFYSTKIFRMPENRHINQHLRKIVEIVGKSSMIVVY